MARRPRTTLADRNDAAISGPAAPEPARSAAPAPSAVRPQAEEPAPPAPEPRRPKAAVRPRANTASSTQRVGIYLTREEFDDARAAYLADWTAGGEADTFARWVAQVLEEHAARSPQERAKVARPTEDGRGGSTRSVAVPTDTIRRMRAAIAEDQRHGRWPTDSGWCGDALAAAAARARAANGGSLAAPPARLPNRLIR